jgi:hypothetical protein
MEQVGLLLPSLRLPLSALKNSISFAGQRPFAIAPSASISHVHKISIPLVTFHAASSAFTLPTIVRRKNGLRFHQRQEA